MEANKMSEQDTVWEKIFQTQEWGKYPPEELIRFVARNYYRAPNRKEIKILDIGCGTGAATWYIAREGFSAYGIDFSKTAIERANTRFQNENLKGEFKVGDFSKIDYPDKFFDVVIDIGGIVCNDIKSQIKIFSEIYRILKPNGKLFSMMIAKGTWGYGSGDEIEKDTFINVKEGPHVGHGLIHFADEEEVKNLLHKFRDVKIECSQRTENNQKDKIIHLVIIAQK
jgi:ubiquinone/menaquinone biosynthesis C-methylase UbiE